MVPTTYESNVSRESIAAGILGALVVGVLVVVALAPNSTTSEVLPPITLEDPESVEPNAAVVVAKHESGGSSIFGFTISRTTHFVHVQFFDEPQCHAVVSSGEAWPTSHEECSSTVPVRGEVSGIGITATGRSIIGVELGVSGTCYDAVTPGDSWPTSAPECRPTP
jgi:hypothetical protein